MVSVISWIGDNKALIAPIVIAVLDFIFAVNPSAQSNGLLHWVYNLIKGSPKPAA